jgi:hypothetical protein
VRRGALQLQQRRHVLSGSSGSSHAVVCRRTLHFQRCRVQRMLLAAPLRLRQPRVLRSARAQRARA